MPVSPSLAPSRLGGIVVASFATLAVGAFAAAPAQAACDDNAPALGQYVTCDSGSDTVLAPAGSDQSYFTAAGAGAGGGVITSTGASEHGGTGALVDGYFDVVPGSSFTVSAGAAGGPGTQTAGGGGGGGYSAIFDSLLSPIAVAGGGGGGGSRLAPGGDGAANSDADGGNGTDIAFQQSNTTGGRGGADGTGGAAGTATGTGPQTKYQGSPGANWSVGGAGGTGGRNGPQIRGGNGGAGYGGGGGGGYLSSGTAAGGGAGGSYADPAVTDSVSFEPQGGVGGDLGQPGAAGSVQLVFLPAAPTVTNVGPTSGQAGGGNSIVITGTNFTYATDVRVGGASCTSFTVDSPTQITCVVPAGTPGAVDVEVENAADYDTAAGAYTYIAAPTVATVSPASGPAAGGASVIITGTDFTNATDVTVGGRPCTSFSVDSPTQVTCVVPSGAAGAADIRVVTPGGSASLAGGYTYTVADAPGSPARPADPAPPRGRAPSAPPAGPLSLKLDLSLDGGQKVKGATARLAGAGLKPSSSYKLVMHSKPIVLARGRANASGRFSRRLALPAKACVRGGLHRLTLTGITPSGASITSTRWMLLDDTCTSRGTFARKPRKRIELGQFLFGYRSAALTPAGRRSLRQVAATVRGAKAVTVAGYTQTGRKGPAARRANIALAGRRVRTVKRFLRKQGTSARFTLRALGPVDPVSKSKQSRNRRVVISANY